MGHIRTSLTRVPSVARQPAGVPDGLGTWEPLSVEGVADLLQDMPTPWWIPGGWALDLHLGRHTRAHDDMDVLVLRRDLAGFHHRLRTWDLHAADPPGVLRPACSGRGIPAKSCRARFTTSGAVRNRGRRGLSS